MDDYFKKQIITYMGNKRKFIPILSNIIDSIKLELNKELVLADGFSGSGIVSRLFKTKSKQLWTNDIAGYSEQYR
jgi:adenine-specific DNA-methyltransferase